MKWRLKKEPKLNHFKLENILSGTDMLNDDQYLPIKLLTFIKVTIKMQIGMLKRKIY
jgi:hypothetical protein